MKIAGLPCIEVEDTKPRPTKPPKVVAGACSIVIVTYNSMKSIGDCLKSALLTLGPSDEILVIDNGSSDGTEEFLTQIKEASPQLKTHLNRKNLGFSAGSNVGLRMAKGEYLVLLNPDTVVTPGWLEKMKAHFRHERVGAVGPTCDMIAGLQKYEIHIPNGLMGHYSYDGLADVFAKFNDGQNVVTKLLIGCCMMISRAALDEVGLLDEELFLGGDDLDLSWRLQLAGYRLLVARDAFIHHENHVSFNTEPKTKTDALNQASIDALAHKLIRHYGEGNVPSQQELWGIDWFSTNVPLWTTSGAGSEATTKLVVGGPAQADSLNISIEPSEESDASIGSIERLKPGLTIETERFGKITLQPDAFDSITVYGEFENVEDPAIAMTGIRDLLKVGGILTVTGAYSLGRSAWPGTEAQRFLSKHTFCPYLSVGGPVGWTDTCFEQVDIRLQITEYGSQLHFNQGLPADILLNHPRAVDGVDVILRKREAKETFAAAKNPMGPDVTILLPVFGRPAQSMRMIEELLNQSHTNIEVFIVGDCCPLFEKRLATTDYQARIADAEKRGMTVHTFNLSANHGTPHGVINHVISNMQGRFLMFAGDDDHMEAHHVAHYLSQIAGSGCDMMFFDSLLVGDFYTNVRKSRMELGHIGHAEIIVTREAAQAAPAHVAHAYQDWYFLQAASAGRRVARASEASPTYWVNLCQRTKHFKAA